MKYSRAYLKTFLRIAQYLLEKRKIEIFFISCGIIFGTRLVNRSTEEALKLRIRCNQTVCNFYRVDWLQIQHLAEVALKAKTTQFRFSLDPSTDILSNFGKLSIIDSTNQPIVLVRSQKAKIYAKLKRIEKPLNQLFQKPDRLRFFKNDIDLQPRWWFFIGAIAILASVFAAFFVWLEAAEKVLDTTRTGLLDNLKQLKREKRPKA